MVTTKFKLLKPTMSASSWNSCNVRSLAPPELHANIARSWRSPNSDLGPSYSDWRFIEFGSTDSTIITFPPLVGNALKQFLKIVTHSSSFQSCKTHCKTNFHQWHDFHEPTTWAKLLSYWIKRNTNVVTMKLQVNFLYFWWKIYG